jgi:hypothetical protein
LRTSASTARAAFASLCRDRRRQSAAPRDISAAALGIRSTTSQQWSCPQNRHCRKRVARRRSKTAGSTSRPVMIAKSVWSHRKIRCAMRHQAFPRPDRHSFCARRMLLSIRHSVAAEPRPLFAMSPEWGSEPSRRHARRRHPGRPQCWSRSRHRSCLQRGGRRAAIADEGPYQFGRLAKQPEIMQAMISGPGMETRARRQRSAALPCSLAFGPIPPSSFHGHTDYGDPSWAPSMTIPHRHADFPSL